MKRALGPGDYFPFTRVCGGTKGQRAEGKIVAVPIISKKLRIGHGRKRDKQKRDCHRRFFASFTVHDES